MPGILPSLKRIDWDKARVFIRAVGLGLLARVRGRPEPRKVLFTNSRLVALFRCGVHILPVAVSTAIISINLTKFFIGDDLEGVRNLDNLKLGAVQIAAKTQELLMVSSMAAMIIHIIRSELVFGDGLPLGLVGSGWSFTQLSYFWSVEFWGGVLYTPSNRTRRGRKALLILLLVFGCMTALLAGPAVAILMVPKRVDLLAGGVVYWLKGGNSQLWPSLVTINATSGNVICSQFGDFDPLCPGGSFYPLYSHYYWADNRPSGFIAHFHVQDGLMRRAMYTTNDEANNIDTWSFTAHMATAVLQDTMQHRYTEAHRYLAGYHPTAPPRPRSFMYSSEYSYQVETKIPFVRASCVALSENTTVSLQNATVPLRFPVQPEFDIINMDDNLETYRSSEVDVLPFIRHAIGQRGYRSSSPLGRNSSKSPEIIHAPPVLAIPIPLTSTDAASLGLVILRLESAIVANSSSSTGVYTAAGCSIDARWANGLSIIQSEDGIRTRGNPGLPLKNTIRTKAVFASLPKWTVMADLDFRPPKDGSLSRAVLTPEWFNLLSPVLRRVPSPIGVDPAYDSLTLANATAMESLLWLVLDPRDDPRSRGWRTETGLRGNNSRAILKSMEEVISVFVADGLAHTGLEPNIRHAEHLRLEQNWNLINLIPPSLLEESMRTMVRLGEPLESVARPPGLTDDNSVRVVMRSHFAGWAIVAQDGFDYFSLGLLLLHILLALLHTFWVLRRGETSDAWDTVPEMIALTSASPPPEDNTLENTSAGVRTLQTMRSMAWVEVSQGTGTGPGEELRFRLRAVAGGGRDQAAIPRVGEEYGAR